MSAGHRMNHFSEAGYNPFSEMAVVSPRASGITIEDLNGEALESLLEAFERRCANAGPLKAQLVVSASAGYGKSHLIGRLFDKVGSRATRVYFQPFNDVTMPWSSLLRVIVQELTCPDVPGEDLDQLDALARGIVGTLVGDMFRSGQVDHPEPESVVALFADPAFPYGDPDHEWAAWLDHDFAAYSNELSKAFIARGLRLASDVSVLTFLTVLYKYTTSFNDPDRRELCLEWLKARPLEQDEAAQLGIPRRDLLPFDASSETVNETAMHRVFDLCRLSSVSRPFLFCFDQTEVFAVSEELTYQFGNVVAQLFQNAPNQLTIITANQDAWTRRLSENIDSAHLDRIEEPVNLKGIEQDSASKLATRRLEGSGYVELAIQSFLDREWLRQIFDVGQIATREFLKKCEERFAELARQPAPARPSLEELLEAERKAILSKKDRLKHNSDILQWLTHDVVGDDSTLGFRAKRQKSRNNYFPITWEARDSDKRIHFGFEDGYHHGTWRAIADEALSLNRRSAKRAKCVILRGYELPPVPRPTWKQARPKIEEACRECLDVKALDMKKVAGLYAGWELYNRACQNDIDYTPQEVLEFLRGKLKEWWNRLAERPKTVDDDGGAEVGTTPDLSPADQRREPIVAIVRSERFLSHVRLLELLVAQGIQLELDDVLTQCGDIPAINVFSHPNQTVFQWQG